MSSGGWRRGRLRGGGPPELLFGRMHEDPALELTLFPPRSRVIAIGSAGCTALALAAAGHRVTAVDVNPAQIDLVRERLGGAPTRPGRVDRLLARGRRAARLLGWRPERVRRFLALDDPEEQARAWREEILGRRLRWALRVALHPALLRRAYTAELVAALPPRFADVVLARLERAFATHPNRTNPYAWRLLLGEEPPAMGTTEPTRPLRHAVVDLVVADIAEHLAALPPASADAFTLSNVLDGAAPGTRGHLVAALRHAAAPGAVALHRTFGEPPSPRAAALALRDRALLWGGVEDLLAD